MFSHPKRSDPRSLRENYLRGRSRTTPHTTRKMETNNRNHEASCCRAERLSKQQGASSTTVRDGFEGPESGKPWEEGWMSDRLDSHTIGTEPATKTRARSILRPATCAAQYGTTMPNRTE